MKVAITGASGFVGKAVCQALEARGDAAVPARRSDSEAQLRWTVDGGFMPISALDGYDAVVHLAGENIAGQRWTEAHKRAIEHSRVQGTRRVVEAIQAAERPPSVLVCMSATGYYGARGDEELSESSAPGEGFLPRTCLAWEREAQTAKSHTRVVMLRLGIVLGPNGGALDKMLPIFKVGLGGKLGSGEQYMSWVHLDDVVAVIVRALDTPTMQGPYNLTAPNPVTNAAFTDALAQTLSRPAIIPVPRFGLKLAFGEMAERLLLEGQRVVPQRLSGSGYEFNYPKLRPALQAILAPNGSE